jgi:hypothetical protein
VSSESAHYSPLTTYGFTQFFSGCVSPGRRGSPGGIRPSPGRSVRSRSGRSRDVSRASGGRGAGLRACSTGGALPATAGGAVCAARSMFHAITAATAARRTITRVTRLQPDPGRGGRRSPSRNDGLREVIAKYQPNRLGRPRVSGVRSPKDTGRVDGPHHPPPSCSACSIASSSVSGSCAPDTPILRLKMKNGTPPMPALRASTSAFSISARSSSPAR